MGRVDFYAYEEKVDLDHADERSFRDDVQNLGGLREVVEPGKSATRHGHSRRIQLPNRKGSPEPAPGQEVGGRWAANMLLELLEHSAAPQDVIRTSKAFKCGV